jgi:hypothetical protein
MARVKISFDRDFVDLDAIKFGDKIKDAYNNIITDRCYETYQREMINCSYKFFEYNYDDNMIDTYWKTFVMCNSSCPIEDPLFGIETPDEVTRILQHFDPNNELNLSNHTRPSESSDSAPTVTQKVPINRTVFLERIGASSVDPSTRTDSPSVLPSSFPSVVPSENPSFRPSFIPSAVHSHFPSNFPSNVPTILFIAKFGMSDHKNS